MAFSELKDFLTDTLGGVAGAFIKDFLVPPAKKAAGKVISEKVKKITDSCRAKMLAFLFFGLEDEIASENFIRWHKKTSSKSSKPGEENRFVDLLTRLWLSIEKEEDKQVAFSKLGRLSDEEFDQALYFLENDALLQMYRRAKGDLKVILGDLEKGAKKQYKKIDRYAKKRANDLLPLANKLRAKNGREPLCFEKSKKKSAVNQQKEEREWKIF